MIMIIPSTLNECGDFFQLENLRKRMKKYGDITQNARDADEIDELLCRFNNRVPAVIFFLEERVRAKGTQARDVVHRVSVIWSSNIWSFWLYFGYMVNGQSDFSSTFFGYMVVSATGSTL